MYYSQLTISKLTYEKLLNKLNNQSSGSHRLYKK